MLSSTSDGKRYAQTLALLFREPQVRGSRNPLCPPSFDKVQTRFGPIEARVLRPFGKLLGVDY
jgi:hypothetical protein